MIQRIGRYEIISTIGVGGMSTVYRARLVGLARAAKEVALKVIHPHLSQDRDFVLMFLDEMRLAMALAHRNIVQTFDAGKSEETYYLVMELVSGLSLREVLDLAGPTEQIPLDLVLFVGAETAAALEYAHNFSPGGQAGGIVHRDISPSNILLSSQGDVKLVDFGVAKVAGRLAVSSSNMIMGKLSYMAPEQGRGHTEPRSDLYSLGACIYEMLTGEPIRVAQDLHAVVGAGRPDPARLAQASGVSLSLRELVLACLDPRPERRPASAGELQRRLGDELFRLPRNPRLASDAHARLQSFLALTLQQHPQQVQKSEKTSALAKILLEEVQALQTAAPRSLPGRQVHAAVVRSGPDATPRAETRSFEERKPSRRDPTALAATDPKLYAVDDDSVLPAPASAASETWRRPQRLAVLFASLGRSGGTALAWLSAHRRLLPWAGVALGLIAGVTITALVMRRDGSPGAEGPGSGRTASGTGQTSSQPAEPGSTEVVRRTDAGMRPSVAVAVPVRPRTVAKTRPRSTPPHVAVSPKRVGPRPVPVGRGGKLLLISHPPGAGVFDGTQRLGKTPLVVSSAKARKLGVYADGYEPHEVSVAAGAEGSKTVQLRKSVLARDVTSLRQLKAFRDAGKISQYSYQKRRSELIAQKLNDLKVKRKMGQLTDEQYLRLVESVKNGFD